MSSTIAAVAFTSPMPGLAPHVNFVLRGVDGAPGLFSLEAVEQPGLRLFVADAAVYVPEYAPPVQGCIVEELGLRDGRDATMLVIVNPAAGIPTVNLQAPLVLNQRNGRCAQVVLDPREYAIRAELRTA